MSPSDFSVLKKFRRKTWSWKSHAELADKQLYSCLDFTVKVMWPLNSPVLNPLDHHLWGNVRDLS